jgi:putative transposase
MRPDYATTYLCEDPRAISRHAVGGHTHFKLDYHFVWRTKFNRKILGPVLAPFLVEDIGTICREKLLLMFGLAIAANDVHLCVRARPSHSPSQVMSWIKSTSSGNVLSTYPELRERYGIRNLWGRGYHVETLGDKNVFAILSYVGKQDERHDLKCLDGYFAEIEEFLGKISDDEDSDEPEE